MESALAQASAVTANGGVLLLDRRPSEGPLLSCIIPTYNRGDWALRSVASAVSSAGTWGRRVEIIVTDDSTSAEVADLIVRYLLTQQIPARVWRNARPLGMAENWNHGLRMSSGEYVAFLHDDDYYEPEGLAEIAQEIAATERGAYLFGVRVVNERGEPRKIQKRHRTRDLAPREALRALLNDSSFARFPGLVFKRELALRIGGFDTRLGEPTDIDMWSQVFAAVGVRQTSRVVANYTVHATALTAGMFNLKTLNALEAIFHRVGSESSLTKAEVDSAYSNFITQFALGGAVRALRRRDFTDARRILGLIDTAELAKSPRASLVLLRSILLLLLRP